MMENIKLRPSVTITTYAASNSSFNKNKIKQPNEQDATQEQQATRIEFSTDLFRKNKQSSVLPAIANGTQKSSRILIDVSQIKGPTGSVRGHKDVVRKSLEGIRVTYNRRNSTVMPSLSSTSSSSSASSSSSSSSSSTSDSPMNSIHHMSTFHGPTSSRQQNRELSIVATSNLPQQVVDKQLLNHTHYLEQLVDDELDLCVVYTTTLSVVRRTFEDSKLIKSILNLNLIKYEERDIYLNQEYKFQLKLRLNSIVVPALFVDGQHVGGFKELESMNESGELVKMLSKFKMAQAPKDVCHCCGNAKYIACQNCNGSRKSRVHHFKFNSIALRCIKCDKNDGLIKCPVCCCTA